MDTNEHDSRTGNLVIGATLVAVGAAIMADRAGLIQWTGMWTLWPLILGGWGLARFLSTPEGEPRQGLLMLTLAAWLFFSDGGWISLGDSWPLIVIAFGLIIALNGGPRRRWGRQQAADATVPPVPADPAHPWRHHGHRRHARTLGPLAVIGIWIAVVIAIRVSGVPAGTISSITDPSSSNRVHVVSVFGRGEHTSTAAPFEGAEVVNVFGRSEIDLRDATLEPGERRQLQVVSGFGAVVVRVPPAWIVDTGAVSAFGGISDERRRQSLEDAPAPAGPAPRLELRGVVMFGRLTIRS
jgi:hypothetical protein